MEYKDVIGTNSIIWVIFNIKYVREILNFFFLNFKFNALKNEILSRPYFTLSMQVAQSRFLNSSLKLMNIFTSYLKFVGIFVLIQIVCIKIGRIYYPSKLKVWIINS